MQHTFIDIILLAVVAPGFGDWGLRVAICNVRGPSITDIYDSVL